MQDLQIFENPEFGEIRALEIDNEPWFVGKDVAMILGYIKPENAIANHVDEEDKTTTLIQGTGSNYKSNTVIINESGLYSLILSSKLPSAKRFRRWVTSEVLPSIRKTGGYIQGQKDLTDEELLERALIIAQRKIEEKDQQLKKARPKILFANAVSVRSNRQNKTTMSTNAGLFKSNRKKVGKKLKKALYFVSAVWAISSTIGIILLIRLAMMSDKLLSGLCMAMAFIIGSIAVYHSIDVCRLRDKERE